MTPEELRIAFEHPERIGENAFTIAKAISRLCHSEDTLHVGREMVIRALEHYKLFQPLNGALDALVRQVGLFPYADPTKLSVSDQLAYEFHRPLELELDSPGIVFHREQAEVYRGLMEGQSYVLSAPTSFGKSLIVDALLASGKFKNVVIVVPTISLIDETRRRLSRFKDRYKVITHPSQAAAETNIFVLTQERAIDRDDIPDIDLLVIDEFYKLNISGNADSERAAILNHALYKLRKKSKQIYLLGPSIQGIPEGFGENFKCTFKRTDFNTVVSEIIFVDPEPSRKEAFLNLIRSINEPTIIYCKSPNQANNIIQLLAESEEPFEDYLDAVADWVGEAYHPEWSLRAALRKRIGLHHGRVPRALAHLNVKLFNERKLRFLVCTSSLIEGVNTVAKNVIIYEGKLATSRLDFFTFQNIRGRSGRMREYFIGRVFVLDKPPEHQLDMVDIPFFTQREDTPLGLLMQVDYEDLSDRSKERLGSVIRQDELPFSILKANAHINPDDQLTVARKIRDSGQSLNRLLAWNGIPNWSELETTCKIIFDGFVKRHLNGVSSGQQLAFLLNEMRRSDRVQTFISNILKKDTRVDTADQAVEAAFRFQRNWASFAFPRYLPALDKIQQEIYSQRGMSHGDYSVYAAQVENLFLPSEISALEEYGISIQLSIKIKDLLTLGEGLDQAIASLKQLNDLERRLSDFERELLNEALSAL